MPFGLESMLGGFGADTTAHHDHHSSFVDSPLEFREFYASACPHCKNMDGAWKAAAAEYQGPVTFKQVECNDSNWRPVAENQEMCAGIPGFPTMKMFKAGKEIDEYFGGRSKDELLAYVNGFDETKVGEAAMGPVALIAMAVKWAMGDSDSAEILGEERNSSEESQAKYSAFL